MQHILSIMLVATVLALGQARADTLLVEGLAQASATAAERPSRGMTMNAVSAKWGAPGAKSDAIGQPPITRWDYGSFVVVFEYDHVVHAVAKH